MSESLIYDLVAGDKCCTGLTMKKYMRIQLKKIEVDKWNEGCRIKTDPGQNYILSWVETKADEFRAAWENSLCKDCILCDKCGYFVLSDCGRFEPNSDNE